MQLLVNLPGYETLSVTLNDSGVIDTYQLCCSSQTIKLFNQYVQDHGKTLRDWPVPNQKNLEQKNLSSADRRAHLLMQELILKARGEWNLPYAGEMVCTCRGVSSESINHAITAKACTTEDVSNWTTASTSCTTCKGKVEELIKYRS